MGLGRVFAVLAVWAGLLTAPYAHADGGAVVARGEQGGLLVTVFASPVPLRAGPVDVSVLVQEPDEESAVLDADVVISLYGGGKAISEATADHTLATNQLLYAARIEVPAPGPWGLRVVVERGEDRSAVDATLSAAPALAPAARFWPWLLMPILVVGVFLLQQWLRER
ncbi:MAG: hypothetical protein P8R42_27905 [Candidatus Binatia bacterium]|nr:hypothetical protein [Candidatus Binatia bacterium]